MTNAPATFKQVDLNRAAKTALRMGPDYRVRLTRAGEIIVEKADKTRMETELDASGEIRL